MQPAYISMVEAAKIANVTDPSTLRQAARRGTLRAVKMGRDWFTTEEWVMAYSGRSRSRVEQDRAALTAASESLNSAIVSIKSLRTLGKSDVRALATIGNMRTALSDIEVLRWKLQQLEARDEPKG